MEPVSKEVKRNLNDIQAYLNVIWRRWWLITLLVVVTVGGVYYYQARKPPRYQATVRLQALPTQADNVAIYGSYRSVGASESARATRDAFIKTLRENSVAWKTIKDLHLHKTPADINYEMWPIPDEADVVVIFYEPTATLARTVVDTHVANALEAFRQERSLPVIQSRQFIEEQVHAQEKRLAAAQSALTTFRLRYNINSVQAEAEAVQATIRAYRNSQQMATVKADQAKALAASYRQQAESALKMSSEAEARQATATADFYRGLAQSNFTNASQQEALVAGQEAAQQRYDLLATQQGSRLAELVGIEGQYQTLSDNVANARQQYSFLLNKLNEAKIKENQALHAGYLVWLDKGNKTPAQRAPTQMGRYLTVAFGASLLVGLLLAFLLEGIDRTWRRRSVQRKQP